MACKHCHKPKLIVEQGRRYRNGGDEYILARVDTGRFALICLKSGNRFEHPTEDIAAAFGEGGLKQWSEVK